MAKQAALNLKPSEPAEVDNYMQALEHPLANVLQALRQIILSTDSSLGEEIKWNAPTFFYTGAMPPSDPKEFKRILIVSNVFKQDSIRLVFWGGARANDTTGFLTGTYPDGRRLASFSSLDDVKAKKKALQQVVRQLLQTLDK
jgi:hypothetical protein